MEKQITSDDLNQMAMDMAISKWALPSEKTWGDIVDRASYFLATGKKVDRAPYFLATGEKVDYFLAPGEKMKKFDRSKINYEWDELLRTRSFIPNTPFWTNAGTDMKSLAACFVIGLEDTMVDIMETAKKMALIMKEGGGVGLTLSHIRPEFAKVGKGDSKRMASGPISFLKIFDAVVEAVKSAGVRRGAAMANLRVDHPDIIKFIECKTDQHTINNFNLSVAITDGFMRTLKERPNQLWITDKRRVDVQENGKWTSKIVEKAYTAKEVFDLIVEHMWKNGEPGVQFIDNVNNSIFEKEDALQLRLAHDSIGDGELYDGEVTVDGDPDNGVRKLRTTYTGREEFKRYNTGIEVSNPCVTGDTLVLTDKGYIPIIDLVGKKVNVWNGEEWSEVEPRKTGENQEIWRVEFSNGSVIRCTGYHKFPILDGEPGNWEDSYTEKEAQNLKRLDHTILWWDPEQKKRVHSYVKSVEKLDVKEDVYCFNEPKRHMFIANSQLTCNCSETFLLENEACNIGSINLYNYVIPFWQDPSDRDVANAHKVGAGWIKHFDLKRDVGIAVDIMNRMIDLSEAPLEEINKAVRASRKIGIGVIGLADVMAACAVKYGSEESLNLIDFIMGECITKTAEKYSLSKDYKNATLTLCAPTGTTGFVANASQGIEPFFMREWKRFVRDEGEKLCAPRSLIEFKESKYYSFLDPEALEEAIKTWWPTAHEITPEEHLKVLLKVQEYQHNSVSKTINLPHDSTVADIQDLMQKAWLGGAKGFTCYRDGSRDSQVLYDSKLTKKNQLEKAEKATQEEDHPEYTVELEKKPTGYVLAPKPAKRLRPLTTSGITRKLRTGCGNLYVTVNSDSEGVCEVFTNLGRNGGCPSQSEAVSRLISLALRSGVQPEEIIEQLKGIRCMSVLRQTGKKLNEDINITSCPDAIGKVMEMELAQQQSTSTDETMSIPPTKDSNLTTLNKCPECGRKIEHREGCKICPSCGWSKCG